MRIPPYLRAFCYFLSYQFKPKNIGFIRPLLKYLKKPNYSIYTLSKPWYSVFVLRKTEYKQKILRISVVPRLVN